MKRILVIRLSAMGDVAMTVPVIRQVLVQYPDVHLDILTRESFRDIFPKHDRLSFIFPDLDGRHHGLNGMYKLFKELKENNYYAVADLHDVLRSQIIRLLFTRLRIPIAKINKGRAEKSALTRRSNKIFTPLLATHVRYANVFAELGFPVALKYDSFVASADASLNIGVAPFAAYPQKMWPLEKSNQLIQKLLQQYTGNIYLFGGSNSEEVELNKMADQANRIISTADMTLDAQMNAMRTLDVMVSMDSANMHLASLVHVPVVSIWGGTHPFAGFLGYGQPFESCVQRNDLDCRPCSVFGNKTCWRGDWACLEIGVEEVMDKIEEVLGG